MIIFIKKFNLFKDIEEVNGICLNYLLATSATGDKEVNKAYDNSIGTVLKKLNENKRVFNKAYQENNQPLVALYRILVFSYIEMSFNLNKHVFALTAELNRDSLVGAEKEEMPVDEIGTNDSIASIDETDEIEVAPQVEVSAGTAENIIIGNGNYIINGSLTIVKDKEDMLNEVIGKLVELDNEHCSLLEKIDNKISELKERILELEKSIESQSTIDRNSILDKLEELTVLRNGVILLEELK